jgi:hypothetical protein
MVHVVDTVAESDNSPVALRERRRFAVARRRRQHPGDELALVVGDQDDPTQLGFTTSSAEPVPDLRRRCRPTT